MASMASAWKYIIITGDNEVYGTDDRAEALKILDDGVVLSVDHDAKSVTVVTDADSDETEEIGAL